MLASVVPSQEGKSGPGTPSFHAWEQSYAPGIIGGVPQGGGHPKEVGSRVHHQATELEQTALTESASPNGALVPLQRTHCSHRLASPSTRGRLTSCSQEGKGHTQATQLHKGHICVTPPPHPAAEQARSSTVRPPCDGGRVADFPGLVSMSPPGRVRVEGDSQRGRVRPRNLQAGRPSVRAAASWH